MTALAAFVAQTPPALWLRPACDALSSPWLLLTTGGGIAAFGLGAATSVLPTWRQRSAAAALAGAALVLAVGVFFPTCLAGPYQMVPEPYRGVWLHSIGEARSFIRFLRADPAMVLQIVMPMMIGAIAATFGAWRGKSDERAVLALLASLLWLGVCLAQYQMRVVYIASAFLPLAAGWLLAEIVSTVRADPSPRLRIASAVCGILMLGFPWAAGVSMFREAFAPGEARVAAIAPACGDPDAVSALDGLAPGIVLAPVELGPNILLHTSHSIVVAGYHRAPAGIIAGQQAFSGDEQDMRRVADAFDADYLAMCLRTPRDGGRPASFAGRLAGGPRRHGCGYSN